MSKEKEEPKPLTVEGITSYLEETFCLDPEQTKLLSTETKDGINKRMFSVEYNAMWMVLSDEDDTRIITAVDVDNIGTYEDPEYKELPMVVNPEAIEEVGENNG